jgi:hypothetical protein
MPAPMIVLHIYWYSKHRGIGPKAVCVPSYRCVGIDSTDELQVVMFCTAQ